ncbi:MAG: hypothetical protein WBA89_25260 [Microcoleus sp.]
MRILNFRFWIDSADRSRGGYCQEIRLSSVKSEARGFFPLSQSPNLPTQNSKLTRTQVFDRTNSSLRVEEFSSIFQVDRVDTPNPVS